MFFFSSLPIVLDSTVDVATISFIVFLLFLSFFSICYIFHIRFKSRGSRHLQNFNSLWTVRFLFVVLIAFWALTELLRLPLFRRRLFFPLELTESQEINLCKVHLVLSFGFFEPGFLATLLFLLDVSVQKTSRRSCFSVYFVLTSHLPIFVLQVYFLFFPNLEIYLPKLFRRSWYSIGSSTILCVYPLLNTVLFAVFGAVFSVSFLVSFWNVVSHVINKALRVRIFVLALTVMTALPLQILLMGLTEFWTPNKTAFSGVAFVAFLCMYTCAVVGEGIMVIRPIADSLAAEEGGGAESCRGSSHGEKESRQRDVESEFVVNRECQEVQTADEGHIGRGGILVDFQNTKLSGSSEKLRVQILI